MSFKDTQSYKELQADWRWIHSMDPEAAAIADQWVKEHPEEWKELEHMLYYSEANFHKRVAPDTLEDVDIKQPLSYNPEAFLPEEVRNAIYDDMRWFDRAKYLPEGSDEDPLMYVRKELDEGLRELTELQREILFRTILPNVVAPVWASLPLKVVRAILSESSLSFLGVGLRTPQASWGNLTQSAMELVTLTTRPWAWLPPGLCIVATGLALLLVGEGLRKALNPRNR